ncbi:hypothetical protein QJS66_03290 [Kocuria rhizophila]|nr:hypothetical protein QJS66_03290 [Kocuria rhizophila]
MRSRPKMVGMSSSDIHIFTVPQPGLGTSRGRPVHHHHGAGRHGDRQGHLGGAP